MLCSACPGRLPGCKVKSARSCSLRKVGSREAPAGQSLCDTGPWGGWNVAGSDVLLLCYPVALPAHAYVMSFVSEHVYHGGLMTTRVKLNRIVLEGRD